MGVERSGYYRYLKDFTLPKRGSEAKLLVEVRALNKLSRSSYGSRQMTKNLQAKGYKVGRYQARTLMRKAGIECKQRRRYQVITQSNHKLPVACAAE